MSEVIFGTPLGEISPNLLLSAGNSACSLILLK